MRRPSERSVTAPTNSPAAARRLRRLGVVMVIVIAAAVAGFVIGGRVRSPAEAAADREPPPASPVGVPVERRALSNDLTRRGSVRYDNPTPLALAGQVGGGGSAQIVTRVPEAGASLTEGDAMIDVNGRPVFALEGAQPMYRTLRPGDTGDDVLQLEQALVRLGFDPGPADRTYDASTELAVSAFYEAHGYVATGLSSEERSALTNAAGALADAQDRVLEAQAALDDADDPAGRVELLGLQNDVAQAEQMVAQADSSAARDLAQASAEVTDRERAIEAARSALATAVDALAEAQATGIDPTAQAPAADDGAPRTACSETCIARLAADVSAQQAAVTAAESARDAAAVNVDSVAVANDAAGASAERSLELARARLDEAQEPEDTERATKQVATAQAAADRASAELAELEATTGTIVPAGEIVFVPSLPLRIDDVGVDVGEAPAAGFVLVSGDRLAVDSSVDAADADLVHVGLPVSIRVPGVDRTFTGTVAEVADTAGTDGVTGSQVYVRITPDDTSSAVELNGIGVVVTIPVASTGDDVLVVPIAAITARADRSTWVERLDADGARTAVQVEVGLQADGLAEVAAATADDLDEGDRVIIGTADDPGVTGADDDVDAREGTDGA